MISVIHELWRAYRNRKNLFQGLLLVLFAQKGLMLKAISFSDPQPRIF